MGNFSGSRCAQMEKQQLKKQALMLAHVLFCCFYLFVHVNPFEIKARAIKVQFCSTNILSSKKKVSLHNPPLLCSEKIETKLIHQHHVASWISEREKYPFINPITIFNVH